MTTLFESTLTSVPLVHRGKVRDSYALGDKHLLIVTTDRLSAFDVILPQPILGQGGAVLTSLSNFWMARFATLIPNHLAADIDLARFLTSRELEEVQGRSVAVKRLVLCRSKQSRAAISLAAAGRNIRRAVRCAASNCRKGWCWRVNCPRRSSRRRTRRRPVSMTKTSPSPMSSG